jgi:hypothetical protein
MRLIVPRQSIRSAEWYKLHDTTGPKIQGPSPISCYLSMNGICAKQKAGQQEIKSWGTVAQNVPSTTEYEVANHVKTSTHVSGNHLPRK